MAVLSKDAFFTRIHDKFADDASDDTISFLEDMTDTYNDMESRANGDGINWEEKYHENDEAWRAKYRNRFFTGDSKIINDNMDDKEDDTYHAEEVKVEDLFEKEGK